MLRKVDINWVQTVQAQRLSLFRHIPRLPDETDAKILTASHWRIGGDHQDALAPRG